MAEYGEPTHTHSPFVERTMVDWTIKLWRFPITSVRAHNAAGANSGHAQPVDHQMVMRGSTQHQSQHGACCHLVLGWNGFWFSGYGCCGVSKPARTSGMMGHFLRPTCMNSPVLYSVTVIIV